MAEITKVALKVDNNSSFPNNNAGAITPSILRAFNTNMIDSLVDEIGYTADSSSWNQQIDSLEQFTASAAGLSTGSLLVTASFNNGTRDLTFTKGDTTTFAVNIPDVSGSTINTGSFVTTSSFNAYTASQSTASLVTSITNLNSATASLFTSASLGLTTASVNVNVITFRKGDGTTFDITVTASGSVTPGTISGSAQITALGFVSSSVTASSLVTASFSGNTLTFTKGDASTFGVVIPDVSGSAGTTVIEVVYTGESITKGDPLYISGSQGANPKVFKADASNPAKMPVTFISNETIGAANTTNAIVLGLIEGIDLTGYTAGQTIYVAEGGGYSTSLPSGSNSITQLLGVITKEGAGGKGLVLNPGPAQLPGLDTGYMWAGNSNNQPIEITTASFASSASFNSYTSSNDQKVDSLIAATGSYATTGSNTFRGNETFEDAGGNASTLVPVSGSLMLVAKSFTSASAHLSASSATQVNLIWKDNSNTADTIISGSSNIFPNPAAPTAGFKRYVGGSNNIFTNTTIPQITGSMQFSPTMNRNIGGFSVPIRGPISSSTWTINDNLVMGGVVNMGTAAATMASASAGCSFQQNLLAGGTINIAANKTLLDTSATFSSNIVFGATLNLNHNSSSISYTSNIQNGGITINNNYIPTVGSVGVRRQVPISINTVYGVNHLITIAGSNILTASVRQATANLLAGTYVTASLEETGDNSSMLATNMLGNALIVSGTSLTPTGGTATADATYGSVFSGRFNATDGNRAKTAETIFAVGTGTGYSNRKTGFLIDSGSNTFIEGTLNVSGSTTITGSLILSSSNAVELTVIGNSVFTGSVAGNVISMSVSSNTASMDFNLGNYFVLSASVSPIRIEVTNLTGGVTSTLALNSVTSSTIVWSSNVLQPSGSAYTASVSGSNDILSFVAFNSSKVNVVSTLKMI